MHSRFDSHPSSKFSPASRRSTSLSSLDDSSMRGRRIPGTNAGGEKERRGEEEKEKEEKGETRAGSGRRSGQLASETRSIEAVFGRENRSKMEETAENSGHSSPNNGDARVCFGNSPCCGGRGCTFPLCATLFLSFPFLFSLLIRGAHVVHQRETFCAEALFFVPQLETALLEHSPSCQEKPSFFWIILAISTTFLLEFLHTSRTRSVFHISLCVRTSSFPFYFHSVLSFSRFQEFAARVCKRRLLFALQLRRSAVEAAKMVRAPLEQTSARI